MNTIDKAIRMCDRYQYKLKIYYLEGPNQGNLKNEEFFDSKSEMDRRYRQLFKKSAFSLNPTAWERTVFEDEKRFGDWKRISGY